MSLQFKDLGLGGVCLITPSKFGDARGFFSETYNSNAFKAVGVHADFVQDNQSLSGETGVLRGLHFQAPPHAQAKLVRVTRGTIYDVAVDIRVGSPTYGNWVGAEISADNWAQIYVPRGFAHGFVTLEPMTEVQYKVDGFYNAEADGGLAWDDPDINIDWPLTGAPLLSEKDTKHSAFINFKSPFKFADYS
jgi:dTDP-4-dehydrorhamnose 3,5-epimerase